MFLTRRFQPPGRSFLRARPPKRGVQTAPEPPPLGSGLRASRARPPTGVRAAQPATRPRARGGRAGRSLTPPAPPRCRRLCRPPPRPAAPIGPLPPRQHLPGAPPGRPAAFPQPPPPSAPARRARPTGAPGGAARRAGEGAALTAPPERSRAGGPPGPHRSPPPWQGSPLAPAAPLTSRAGPPPHTANDPLRRSRARAPRGGKGRSREVPLRPSGPAPGALPGGGAAQGPARMRLPHSHSNRPAKGTWGRDHPYVGRSRTSLFFTKMAAGPSASYPA